jgi:hypothetical protein
VRELEGEVTEWQVGTAISLNRWFDRYFNDWPGADIPPMMRQTPLVLRQVCMHRNATTSLPPLFGAYVAVTL